MELQEYPQGLLVARYAAHGWTYRVTIRLQEFTTVRDVQGVQDAQGVV